MIKHKHGTYMTFVLLCLGFSLEPLGGASKQLCFANHVRCSAGLVSFRLHAHLAVGVLALSEEQEITEVKSPHRTIAPRAGNVMTFGKQSAHGAQLPELCMHSARFLEHDTRKIAHASRKTCLV